MSLFLSWPEWERAGYLGPPPRSPAWFLLRDLHVHVHHSCPWGRTSQSSPLDLKTGTRLILNGAYILEPFLLFFSCLFHWSIVDIRSYIDWSQLYRWLDSDSQYEIFTPLVQILSVNTGRCDRATDCILSATLTSLWLIYITVEVLCFFFCH